ncbi:hypothetical protein LL912_12400 [Niabella sp. CC-SYL272]|uniref:hypothetical protein n=1 Tax=Niabella agricola TaxID=2891571 RepID=UPI001F273F95|nr:hypothetical protein [Niabella agricola]MCF3109573.1 hypothetical protein [Niabella agricola]
MPDFFTNNCQEAPRSEPTFGLCDDSNNAPAYTNIADPETWIATVNNKSGLPVIFTAIDKCIIQDHEFEGRGRCDGMLTTTQHLYLVELKDRDYPGVIPAAVQQLVSTVEFLYEYHPKEVSAYRHKKIFACNKRKPKSVEVDSARQKQFFDTYRFRIDIQATVLML